MTNETALLKIITLFTVALTVVACGSESDPSSSDTKMNQTALEDKSPRTETTEQKTQTTPDPNQEGNRQSQIEWLVQQARNPNLGREPGAIEKLVQTARSLNNQSASTFPPYFGGLPQSSGQQDPLIQSIIQNALEIDKNGANQQNLDAIIQNGQQLNRRQASPGQAFSPHSNYDWSKWLP